MNVPKGFKQTEVGVIPEDWHLVRIGDALKFKNGLNKEKKFFGHGTPIVNYMDVFHKSYILEKNLKGKVTLSQAERKNYDLRKGDVFFTRTSETIEEIGVASVCIDDFQDTVFSGFLLRARPIKQLFETEFCRFCFSSDFVRQQIIKTSSITTRALTNGRLLSEVKIPIPPTKAEQTAISAALSDMDALIEGVEKLLEKKRRIKQGAMQELLRPKEGWKNKILYDFLTQKPQYGIGAAAVPYNENLPTYLRITDISEDGRLIKSNLASVDNPFSSSYYLENNDLVFARTGNSVGKSYLYNMNDGKLVFAGFLIRVKVDQALLSPTYLKYFVQSESYWNWINFMSMRTGQPGINGHEYSMLPVDIPKNRYEQEEIAAILSDMASEIEQLETQLAKYRQLKTGMMQELLTGKKRLV